MFGILPQKIEQQIRVREGCVLDLHITYPMFPEQRELTALYRREAENYLAKLTDLCRTTLADLPMGALGPHLRAEQTYTIGWEREDFVSLYFDRYEDMGLYHTALGRRSDLWRMPEGRPMTMGELFRDPAQVRQRVEERIARVMADDPPGQWFGGWQRKRRWFFLTERGLCIYFRPGDIASGAAGIPLFLIPWSHLEGCLNFPL
ncbi:MAG: DUF3298 domain-containing protein [Clostridia bacterium]|nr:DUF3298 domain-containing protein [Clostridia bacterium]